MRIEVGKFFEVGVLAIFRFTAHLNDCRSESIGYFAPLRYRCSVSLDICSYNRALEIVNWSNFTFLTSSGGKFYKFFVTFALVIHHLTVKNRPCVLIWACALNPKNTVHLFNLVSVYWVFPDNRVDKGIS